MDSTAFYLVKLIVGSLFTLLGVVIFVYLLSYSLDRMPCFNSGPYVLTPREIEARREASDLIQEAKLAGLLHHEKMTVFRRFFERRSFLFKEAENIQDDIEAPVEPTPPSDDCDANDQDEDGERKNIVMTNVSLVEDDDSIDETITSSQNDREGRKKKEEEDDDDGNDSQNENSCSICLNVYEDNDKVITGARCKHMFHFDCCMQWIEKNQDNCPYCRVPLMTTEGLVCTAREVIGETRSNKLVKINEEAAARRAAYCASLRRTDGATTTTSATTSANVPPLVVRTTATEGGTSGDDIRNTGEAIIDDNETAMQDVSVVSGHDADGTMDFVTSPKPELPRHEPTDAEQEGDLADTIATKTADSELHLPTDRSEKLDTENSDEENHMDAIVTTIVSRPHHQQEDTMLPPGVDAKTDEVLDH